MLAELGQAVLVDVLQPNFYSQKKLLVSPISLLWFPCASSDSQAYVHAGCASCDFATLPQAVQLSSSVRVRLALHVVIVVSLAARSNEEARAHKRCRRSSNLLDLGNGVRERSGVHEDLLVEPEQNC